MTAVARPSKMSLAAFHARRDESTVAMSLMNAIVASFMGISSCGVCSPASAGKGSVALMLRVLAASTCATIILLMLSVGAHRECIGSRNHPVGSSATLSCRTEVGQVAGDMLRRTLGEGM